MTDDTLSLGRRAVACKGWRWMPGMRVRVTSDPPATGTVTGYPPALRDRIDVAWDGGVRDHATRPSSVLPDLSDPATIGCLVAIVREAWGGDYACARVIGVHADGRPEWAVLDVRHSAFTGFHSEAEALVVALESNQ